MTAQFSQAAGSLVISVLSVRQLGLADFATLSVLLAGVVFVTGITTGLIGDSLTVLDRAQPALRTALQRVQLAVMAASLTAGAVSALLGLQVSAPAAAAFGVLLALWIAEDTLRRLLMATLRFWAIVVVDSTHLVVSSGLALGYPLVTGHHASIGLYLVALSCGQACAGAVAVAFLPPAERRWQRAAPGGLRRLLAFGSSRSVQASLRPLVLLLMRLVVIAIVGRISYGQLEAARLYAAPALLIVNGFGSFLLSTFAADRTRSRRQKVRRADLSSLFLILTTLALTGLGVGLAVWWPSLLSKHVTVAPAAVLAWGVFTGAVAVSLPYGSLVAVAGGQRRVLAVRAVDSTISLLAMAVLLGTGVISTSLAPAALAVGPVVAALLLRPLALREPEADAAPAGAAPAGAAPAMAASTAPAPTSDARLPEGSLAAHPGARLVRHRHQPSWSPTPRHAVRPFTRRDAVTDGLPARAGDDATAAIVPLAEQVQKLPPPTGRPRPTPRVAAPRRPDDASRPQP